MKTRQREPAGNKFGHAIYFISPPMSEEEWVEKCCTPN